MHYDDFSGEYDAMFAQLTRRTRRDCFVPNTDVYVDAAAARISVHVELAGVEEASLRVELEDRSLIITGRRFSETQGTGGDCILKEIEFGDFERRIDLPLAVDADHTVAKYHDGILAIVLPVHRDVEFPIMRTEIRLVIKRKAL